MSIKIKGYNFLESIDIVENNNEFGFGEYENETSGNYYEILWIKNSDSIQPTIKRIFGGIKSLINSPITKLSEVNDDSDNNISFIVYERLECLDLHYTISEFAQCIDILDKLKKQNRYGIILNENTIIKYKDGDIEIRFVGLFKLFQKKIIRLIGDDNFPDSKLQTSDDIQNLSSLFEKCFDNDSKFIFEKCQNQEYKKYSELQKDIDSLPVQENPDYSEIRITGNEDEIGLDELANELNKGCYWFINESLSTNDEVKIQWSTKTISGIAFVKVKDKKGNQKFGFLFIAYIDKESNNNVLIYGEKAKFNFKNRNYQDEYDPIDFFYEKYEAVNQLAKLNNTKDTTLSKWAALPKKEKEYIEEEAFKAQYTARKTSKNNSENIIFELDKELKNWEKIKQKKNDGVELLINDTIIGEILDYKQKEELLIIKDYQGDLETIPEQGELVEDVKQLTSQYKKQIEACEKIKKNDIANPDLAALIATPETSLPHLNIDYDELELINHQLLNDKTQKNTVIDAINKKPIYLIQGPPGTGKTTVIVEIVQQLIKKNKDIKILIVSQSNMAVDNVLEKLPKNVAFMRLASTHARNDNISDDIKEHIFETKLKRWIKETEDKANKAFTDLSKVDPILLYLFEQYNRKNMSVSEFQKEYRQSNIRSYAEKLFESVKSKKDIESVFYAKLGSKYIEHKKILNRWLSFIRNATSSKKEKQISSLKYGSEDIPLNTAYARSMNVLGSTCIHVASFKYAKIISEFDYMIMDEASKATSAEASVPITMAKNIILIGDQHQLPPVVTKEKEIRQKIKDELEDDGLDIDKTYGRSLFEELFAHFKNDNAKQCYTTMLDIQYRMPRQLGSLISKHIYDGLLKNPNLKQIPDYDLQKSHNLRLKLKSVNIDKNTQVPNSVIVVSTSNKKDPVDNGNKFKRSNICNVTVIKQVLNSLQQLKNKDIPKEIGIIAAYRGQVELLKNKIIPKKYIDLSIDINTVDKFQGAERDIIIYDLVRSSKGIDNIGFLDDYRRINVAFSRAKKLLIIVGDSEYIIKRAKASPQSGTKARTLVIKKIMTQLQDWGCIYNTFDEAIENE